MTTRRRLLVFGLLATLTGLGVGGWLLWPPPTAITRENAAKIRVGMTPSEVEAILGGPARDETTGPVATDDDTNTVWFDDVCVLNTFSDPPRPQVWKSDRVHVLVWVDAEWRVSNFFAFPQRRVDENLIPMLRRWLRL